MPESEGLRLGRAAVARIFSDEAKLREFLKQVRDLRFNPETCQFRQIESVVRELCPPAGATARGRPIVVTYQDLPDNEDEVLEQFFRQHVNEAKRKHPNHFN
jgi:hypothetical protein